MGSSELKLSMVVRNMIEYPPVERAQEGRKMDRCDSLILTGWGYAEYVASAAVALKALNGEAEVLGVSRRRLPELMEEISERKKSDRWSSIYLLGVSLFGDPERLAAALGTLFLDEIGEMSIEVQAILLRVLEGGRFMRVGGKEELRCDVRLVTATNRDLPTLVREGRFREDLYQRLNVVQMRTPSLREHKDDIPIIANAWWRKFHGNRTLGEGQIAALMDYDYPGNVRELVNILDRATALEEDDFDLLMREHKEMNAGLAGNLELKSGRVPDRLEDAIRLHIRRVYEKYGQNLSRAAEALDVSRNTVRKHLQ